MRLIVLIFTLGSSFWPVFGTELTLRAKLKPRVYERITKEKESNAYARLNDSKHYEFYVASYVKHRLKPTHLALSDYPKLKDVIPFVDRAEWVNGKKDTLEIEGGIWSFRLKSTVKFVEKTNRWTQFEITSGHFLGLKGDILLEEYGDGATLVYVGGALVGNDKTEWPPTIVLERGAEIVLSVAARNMRKYIEEQKHGHGSRN